MPQRSARPASKAIGSNRASKWEWPTLAIEEVKRAIFSSFIAIAPGPDAIGFKIIQEAYRIIPDVFNKVYITLFETRYHPSN